jgi:caa(3)-type oxidase subunit IV
MYWIVGLILLILTGVTVGLSYVDFGSHARNVVVGMLVATIKVALVAAIFMHLKGEKPMIWRFLYFTVFFFAGLFLLTLFQWYDPIFGTSHTTR